MKHWISAFAAAAMLAASVTMLAASTHAASSSGGQQVSTNEWKTTMTGSECSVRAAASLSQAGLRHVTSGKVHKDGAVVLYADQDIYQATVFCLDNHIAAEVTGPDDTKASALIDAFVKAWNAQ